MKPGPSCSAHDIALAVSEAIGTDLFGLDIVISRGQAYVVDVNPFPGFKGVPDGALRLAEYIYAKATASTAVDTKHVGPAGGRLMRITFLLAQRVPDVSSPVIENVSHLLAAAGHVVDGWIPESRLLRTDRFLPDADLYIC